MIVLTVIVIVMLAVMVGQAFAGDGYGSQPGYPTANGNTVCAGHGAFGAFGTTGDVVHDFGINNLGSNGKPGASRLTGPTNAVVCGNPQDTNNSNP